ncbi:MAG: helix-turn-helix transcriptional regulator [Bacteroides sp.]|nr:helix-turn-helix transcriptional regulator [Bacteroides sp.]
MEIKDRIKRYLSFKHMSLRELERQCSISNGVLGRINKSTSPKTLKRIEDNCDINLHWLLTGEGEMLRHTGNISAEGREDIESMRDEVPEKYVTYLVPMSAMGGNLVGFEEDGVRREDCERVISPIANIDWVVPVCGDSMEPEYPNGSKVYVRQINPGDFIPWGNVFVLDTTNGLVIKMVVESDKKDCVRCVSLNPSGRYTPFDVPIRTIRAMYRVILCVALK